VLPQNGLSPAPQVFLYNASTSALGATSLALNASFPALNRQASRILLGGFSIYDAGFQLLGGIGGSSPDSQTLSPDGTRAYAADRISGGLLVPTRLRTFDLTATPVSGQFPEIGTGTSLPSDTGRAVMTVSPDGGTVFIAGSDSMVVVPAP
jgi:DNA-binding beta-propeller fold protein YncE